MTKTDIQTLFAQIRATSSGNKPPRKVLPAGEYSVKLHSAELTESKKGKKMAKLVFSVLDAGEYKDCWALSYTVLEGLTDDEAWKAATVLNTAAVGYGIPEEKIAEDAENLQELCENAVTLLAKSKYSDQIPVSPIRLIRTETGTAMDGSAVYTNVFRFPVLTEAATDKASANKASADTDISTNADFYAQLEG